MLRHRHITLLLAGVLLAACGTSSTSPSATPTPDYVHLPAGAYTNVTPAQLAEMLKSKDFVFVNTHIPYEGEIEATDAFVPYNEIEQNLSKLPSDKGAKIVLYCRSGRMSAIAAETLVGMGYSNIWNLDGGMIAWEAAGYPLK